MSRARPAPKRPRVGLVPMEEQSTAMSERAPRLAGIGDTVIPVFILSALLPLRGIHHLIPGIPDLPINTMAAIALVGLSFFFRPRWRVGMLGLGIAAAALAATLLIPSALSQEDFNLRRAGSLATLFGLGFVVAQGRLHLDSVRRGLLTGLIAGAALSLIAPSSGYEGRLTGVLGDPNGYAFTMVVIGFVVAQGVRRRRYMFFLLAFIGVTIWFTQSRTTLFAFAVALLWAALGRRLGKLIGILTLIGITWAFQWTSEFSERQGWFVERLGSDNLRDRLAEVERTLTDTAGWWGHGLGTAEAVFDGIFLFFHNSYRALQTEGGLVALILLMALGAALYWNFFNLPTASRPAWAEAAIIAGAICSVNIGYSLTSVPMAVAIGMYIAYHCQARAELSAESAEPDPYRAQ